MRFILSRTCVFSVGQTNGLEDVDMLLQVTLKLAMLALLKKRMTLNQHIALCAGKQPKSGED